MGEDSNTRSKIGAMIDLLEDAAQDAEKFDRGNASAGTRLRKALQQVKTMAQDLRVEVQTIKKARKGE